MGDISECAHKRDVPISKILAEFFKSDEFTKKEMGSFARSTSIKRGLSEGAVTLIHTLGITAETVSSERIWEDYIALNLNPNLSWDIDNAMNWSHGTN